MPKEGNHQIILFDGVCNLCNGFVVFVIKRDKNNLFHFASLQSDTGKKFINEYQIQSPLGSVLLVDPEKKIIKNQSTAVLSVFKKLSGLYPVLFVFIIIPKFIRDFFYKWIAKNRYRWFGKKDQCMIPTPELKDKFLDN